MEELQLDSVGGLEANEATMVVAEDELTLLLMLLLLLFLLLFALPMAETEVLAETETEALVMIVVEELFPGPATTAKLLGGTFGGIGST